MSPSRLRVSGLSVVLACLVVACSSSKKIDVGSTCLLNTDCNASLVCTMGKCHEACRASADCPSGQSCVKTSEGIFCQLPAEVSCAAASTCGAGLMCAPDQRCRAGCQSAASCTEGQVCASNFCADPNDPALVNGQLLGAEGLDGGAHDTGALDTSGGFVPDVSLAGVEAGPSKDAPDAPPALDAPAGPDVPAPPLDGGTSPDAPEAGRACTNGCDDGLFCTTDSCVAGICQNPLNPGYCVIDKTCHREGDPKPGDTCQACAPTSSTTLWTPLPEGATCGTAKSCQSHVCRACGDVGQVCCGTSKPGACVVGASCNLDTNQCQVDKAIDISGTYDTFCALFQSGRVRCWGTNRTMLGTNTDATVATPPTAGLEDAADISVGKGVVCAVRATGAVVCWGSSLPGGGSSALPLPVPGITNARQVSAGPHTCVRTADSRVLCWGNNNSGELGDGTMSATPTSVPTEMQGVNDAKSVVACGNATCVLHGEGQVSCTGAAGENGQVSWATVLTDIPGLTNVESLSCTTTSAVGNFCAATQMGTLTCWGNATPPAIVLGVGQATKGVWGGLNNYFAVQPDGSVWALGPNTYGQLGDGTFAEATSHTSSRLIHSALPVTNVIAMALSEYPTTCLLRADGSVSCAGATLGDGQLQSPGAPRAYFVPVVGILPVASEDGQCSDDIDNDGDGKADLDDADCAQDLGTATGTAVAQVAITGVFGNYLNASCLRYATSGPEAVLTWTAPSSGTYQFDTSGSTFDTLLAAYHGKPSTSTELACNDDDGTLGVGPSAIQVSVTAGEKLTLVVDSNPNAAGIASFQLNITKQ